MQHMDKAKSMISGRRRVKGVAAVEMALVLIPLLLIIAGIVEFGRTLWYYNALTKAARDGARMMSMAPEATIKTDSIYGAVAAQALVLNTAISANVPNASTNLTTTVACDNAPCVNGNAPEYVMVSVSYDVHIGDWFPFIGNDGWDVTFEPMTTMRYMCAGAGSC